MCVRDSQSRMREREVICGHKNSPSNRTISERHQEDNLGGSPIGRKLLALETKLLRHELAAAILTVPQPITGGTGTPRNCASTS